MKEEVKDLWVGALRSGEYKQTQSVLKNDAGFCCLGVLCDLYQKSVGEGHWFGSTFQDGKDGESDTNLPYEVKSWAGILISDPYIRKSEIKRPNIERTFLSSMNDEYVPFSQIADVIEAFHNEL